MSQGRSRVRLWDNLAQRRCGTRSLSGIEQLFISFGVTGTGPEAGGHHNLESG
jgi:hypothetical protein